MAVEGVLLLLVAVASPFSLGSASMYKDKEADWDRERARDDYYYGGGGLGGPYSAGGLYGGYGGFGGYGGLAGAKDMYAGAGGGLPDRRDPSEDDCSRVEAKGVLLPDVLREAAVLLGDKPIAEAAPEVQKLVAFFMGDKHRRFLLAYCPQAVVLASLMQAGADHAAGLVKQLEDLLETASTLQRSHRVPPKWTGQPWEAALQLGQQRTGTVLFPTGEQQFKVERISTNEWFILTRRRCAGRRDLGNLQATPLATCLEKCAQHPLCKSATFWHWQPGGYGFEQRCFLSSSCTAELATSEGAEGAVLFEKRDVLTSSEKAKMQRTIVGHGTLPWAPRCGHRLLATKDPKQLWLMGGIGVDAFRNTSNAEASSKATTAKESTGAAKDAVAKEPAAATKDASAGPSSVDKPPAGGKAKRRRAPTKKSNVTHVIEAYLSRHVELSGELPPLRSLPYGRLGDVWRSDDHGASWALVTSSAPWGPRSFFGAVTIRGGQSLLLMGGVREAQEDDQANSSVRLVRKLAGQYSNDIWWFDLQSGVGVWRELQSAAWEARSGFQVLLRQRGSHSEDVIVMGGRLANGSLLNDVWSAEIQSTGHAVGTWHQIVSAAPWARRADFAAVVHGQAGLWIMGGCDELGRALMDVWKSADAKQWFQVTSAAPWGPRVGAAALSFNAEGQSGLVVLYGGFSYPDAGFQSVQRVVDSAPVWSSAVWASDDGVKWQPLNATLLPWTPSAMHSSLVAGSCKPGVRSPDSVESLCAYVAGGLTQEGYFDNSVYRLSIPATLDPALSIAGQEEVREAAATELEVEQPVRSAVDFGIGFLWLGLALGTALVLCIGRAGSATSMWSHVVKLDNTMKRILVVLFGTCIVSMALATYVTVALARISQELHEVRTQPPQYFSDTAFVSRLWSALGLTDASERWSQIETLLRLAAKESQFGFGGGYDSYGRGRGYDTFGGRGLDRDYGYGYGGYGGYGGYSMGSPYGDQQEADLLLSGGADPASPAAQERELANLPTTQGLSCRSPKCDRNVTACARTAGRSLTTPYGCCSDYMLLMLRDVTEWLDKQNIPYFITYGTLLGAVREEDIIPYTQDMDIVVDRSHWSQLQRGLEAAEFFGGRRYLFGVDQWEERVARVCADWEGFAATTIGAADSDRFTRSAEFHLDVYASDWWQITDLHLMDCVAPLGTRTESIRGLNFSAPARPRACLEKLYGAEWRTPKRGLSGVN